MKIFFILFVFSAIVVGSGLTARPWAKLYKSIPVQKEDIKDVQMTLDGIATDCSDKSDPMKIINITTTPDPPKKGQDLTIAIGYNLSETVTEGKVSIKVKLSFITVLNKDYDLCDMVREGGKSCPLEPSVGVLSTKQSLPGDAPGGHYKGSVIGTDQNGKQLFCLNLDFHL